jgi:hypothetical protein
VTQTSDEPSGDPGDAGAQYRAGVELLSAPDSDQQLAKGIALLEAASASGCSAATELCAVFEAMGVARPPSWNRAFDRLVEAAEQGSLGAGRQLLLLADPTSDPGEGQRPATGWEAVRRRISLDRLLRIGERVSLSDAPKIRVIRGFATPPECRWVIERARERLKPAMIFDSSGKHVVDPGRSNSGTDFQVVEMDLILELLRARISAATRVPLPVFELTQVFHYAPGEEFRLHHDFLDPANADHRKHLAAHGQRIATFLVYLNDAFEGGETEFPDAGIRFRGETGDAIFWAKVDMQGAPDPKSLHSGLPPRSGEKWLLSQWIRDRPASPA